MASSEAQDRVMGADACSVSGGRERHGEWAAGSIDTWQTYVSQIPNDSGAPSPRLFQSLPNTHPCAVGKVWQEVPGCSIPPMF